MGRIISQVTTEMISHIVNIKWSKVTLILFEKCQETFYLLQRKLNLTSFTAPIYVHTNMDLEFCIIVVKLEGPSVPPVLPHQLGPNHPVLPSLVLVVAATLAASKHAGLVAVAEKLFVLLEN